MLIDFCRKYKIKAKLQSSKIHFIEIEYRLKHKVQLSKDNRDFLLYCIEKLDELNKIDDREYRILYREINSNGKSSKTEHNIRDSKREYSKTEYSNSKRKEKDNKTTHTPRDVELHALKDFCEDYKSKSVSRENKNRFSVIFSKLNTENIISMDDIIFVREYLIKLKNSHNITIAYYNRIWNESSIYYKKNNKSTSKIKSHWPTKMHGSYGPQEFGKRMKDYHLFKK